MANAGAEAGPEFIQSKATIHQIDRPANSFDALCLNSAAARFAAQSYGVAALSPAAPDRHDSWSQLAYDRTAGVVDIGAHVVEGAAKKLYNDVVNNPRQAFITAAEGVAIGATLVAAAPLAATLGASAAVVTGLALASEGAVMLLTAGSVAKAAADTINAATAASSAADVVMHQSAYSKADVEKARKEIEEKTGDAAISVVLAGTMALGAVGFVGKMAKFGDSTSAAMVESTVNGAVSKLPKLELTERSSARLHTEAADEPAGRIPQVADREIESAKPGAELLEENYKMPPGTVEQLDNRISSFLSERVKSFDIQKHRQQISVLEEEGFGLREKFGEAVGDMNLSRRLSRSTKTPEDIADMRRDLASHPEGARIFERYLEVRKADARLRTKIEDEFSARRAGLEQIVNEEAPKLWPDEVVPNLKVVKLTEGKHAKASYSDGQLRLRDSDLEDTDQFSNELTGYIAHEAKHGEQDALMVRAHIDKATNGDTTGRSLTEGELQAVAQLFKSACGRSLPDSFIEDVNAKRAGRLLNAEQNERAKVLSKSNSELKHASFRHDFQRNRLNLLKDAAKIYDEPDQLLLPGSLDFLDDHNMFPVGLSPELESVKYKYDSLNWDDSKAVEDFQSRAIPLVRDELKHGIEETQKIVDRNRQEYRNWAHEVEAWNVLDETKIRMSKAISAYMDRLSNMLLNSLNFPDHGDL
ncbi:MAG TPA: hypothetical protein V6C86_15295 [Oculatellaceae cyanobacterium]